MWQDKGGGEVLAKRKVHLNFSTRPAIIRILCYLQITVASLSEDDAKRFMEESIARMEKPPFNQDTTFLKTVRVSFRNSKIGAKQNG